jgi:NACalpha-BTF3-like transcription factor
MNSDKLNFIRNLYKEEKEIETYQIQEEDIQIILKQVETTRELAEKELKENNGDIVKSIINIYSTIPLK